MQPIEILLPEQKRQPEGEDPKFAAMFIDHLSSAPDREQTLEIANGMVISGNAKVREFLTMLLRTKRFDQFLDQGAIVKFRVRPVDQAAAAC